MDLTKYQVFLKTVECGSFTAAAQQLSFTQSGVSHAISGLEEELGVTLLSRSRGGVTLTADGWALMPYIQEICRQQRSIEERAKDLRGLETGVVRVAVFTSVSVQWMPYILKSFREQYPNIEFELLPSNFNNEISDWVLRTVRRTAAFWCCPRSRIWTAGYCSGTSGRPLCRGIIRWRGGSRFHRRHWLSIPSFCWRRETTTKFRRCWTRWECSPMCSTGCSRIR